MIPCSEDNRTRTYQPRQSVRTPLDYDTQFESELPPEIRAELEAPPAPIKRGPVRPPETEEEIQAAIAWLRSQGYSPPTTSAPVRPLSAPPPPVVQVPTPPRAERVPHRGWGLIWMVFGGVFLWALLHNQGSQPSASRALTEWSFASCILAISSRQPEVRRALPVDVRRAMSVVPRAQLASPPVAPTGQWHTVKLLDGSVVQACYSGQMDNAAQLPGQGAFIGQEFSTGTGPNVTDWIWLQPAGAHFASWVDP